MLYPLTLPDVFILIGKRTKQNTGPIGTIYLEVTAISGLPSPRDELLHRVLAQWTFCT